MSTRNSVMPSRTAIFGPRMTPSIGKGLEFLGVPDPRIARVRRESGEFLTALQARTMSYPFRTVSEIPSPGLFPVPGMFEAIRRTRFVPSTPVPSGEIIPSDPLRFYLPPLSRYYTY